MTHTTQKNPGHVIAALILIGLGVLFWLDISLLWPLFVLVPGVMLMAITYAGGRATAPFAIPGMLALGIGGLLLFQNVFDYWQSWSYAWTLFGAFLGMGLIIMGQQVESDDLQRVGRGFVKFSLILFAGFAVLMEVVIGVSGSGLGPLLLIGAGLYLLMRNTVCGTPPRTPKRKPKAKRKLKRQDDVLFTGPVVYGSRHSAAVERDDRVL
jgi:hypothetical protein